MEELKLKFIIFISISIFSFVTAILAFKGKISGRRSVYFATKEEKSDPDFGMKSKILFVTFLLIAISSALFDCYWQYKQSWMETAAGNLFAIIIAIQLISGLIFGLRARKSNKSKHKKIITSRQNIAYNEQKMPIDEKLMQFSVKEHRIDFLKVPIILFCYVMTPLTILAYALNYIYAMPQYYRIDIKFSSFVFSSALVLWLLNKTLPKMTFSYFDGHFIKNKGGKEIFFSRESIKEVTMESVVLPDCIYFHITEAERPIKIPMKNFSWKDRFDITRKVIMITKMNLSKTEWETLHDFDKQL